MGVEQSRALELEKDLLDSEGVVSISFVLGAILLKSLSQSERQDEVEARAQEYCN